jgi:hypothetical protein
MATISDILNVVQCGLGNTLGTGTKGCEAFFKKTASLWITKRGFKYDSTRTLNNAYIEELKASGDLIILKGVKTFEDNSSDDTIETLSDQTSSVASLGLYQFTYGFTKGLGFLSALASLRSFNSYDVAFVDVENNILSTSASDGSMKGFSTNMLNPSRLSFATDSEGIQKQYITLQLSERDELDTDRRVFVDKGSLESGFYPKTIDGVNEVVLSFTAVPTDTDTSISVKATLKQDGSAFTGASYTDFLITKNGTTANPTAGNDNATAGTYVLTVAALATNDVLKISLYDNSNSRIGIVLDSEVFKSNTDSVVVVA